MSLSDDEAFIRAILDAPGDDAPRLVYADWLDERGDPRGAFLRAESAVFHELPNSAAHPRLQIALGRARKSVDPDWALRVSRPPFGACVAHVRFEDSGWSLTDAQ